MKNNLQKLISTLDQKTYASFNFGCRVNASETNQLCNFLEINGFKYSQDDPSIIVINTCAITKKGENESIRKINSCLHLYAKSHLVITGCASKTLIPNSSQILYLTQDEKQLLSNSKTAYSTNVPCKLSKSRKFLLKIQSGCNQFCSYCIVPYRRQKLWSLSITDTIKTIGQALDMGFTEIIVTGVNLNLYKYNLPKLISKILQNTGAPLISFGSIPLNCISPDFLKLFLKYPNRLSHYLHIPLQSCSTKILKSMNRPYTKKDILTTFTKLKKLSQKLDKPLSYGTDIIVGYPLETDTDFQQTYTTCQQIGFSKIHTFRYSPRPQTKAKAVHTISPKIPTEVIKQRSAQIRSLSKKII